MDENVDLAHDIKFEIEVDEKEKEA